MDGVPARMNNSRVFDSHTAGVDVNASLRGDGYKNDLLSGKRAGF